MIFTIKPFLKCHLHLHCAVMMMIIMILIMSSQDGINPTLSVGQWYLVNYEGAIFLREVTKSVGTETEVNYKVMTKT